MATRTAARPKYADVADKAPNWRHYAFADWATKNTGVEVDPKTAQLCFALLNEFRASEDFATAKKAHANEAEEAKRAAAQKRAERDRERADRLAAEAEKLRQRAQSVSPEQAAPANVTPLPAAKKAPSSRPAKKAPSKAPATKTAAARRKAPSRAARNAERAASTSVVAPVQNQDDDEF